METFSKSQIYATVEREDQTMDTFPATCPNQNNTEDELYSHSLLPVPPTASNKWLDQGQGLLSHEESTQIRPEVFACVPAEATHGQHIGAGDASESSTSGRSREITDEKLDVLNREKEQVFSKFQASAPVARTDWCINVFPSSWPTVRQKFEPDKLPSREPFLAPPTASDVQLNQGDEPLSEIQITQVKPDVVVYDLSGVKLSQGKFAEVNEEKLVARSKTKEEKSSASLSQKTNGKGDQEGKDEESCDHPCDSSDNSSGMDLSGKINSTSNFEDTYNKADPATSNPRCPAVSFATPHEEYFVYAVSLETIKQKPESSGLHIEMDCDISMYDTDMNKFFAWQIPSSLDVARARTNLQAPDAAADTPMAEVATTVEGQMEESSDMTQTPESPFSPICLSGDYSSSIIDDKVRLLMADMIKEVVKENCSMPSKGGSSTTNIGHNIDNRVGAMDKPTTPYDIEVVETSITAQPYKYSAGVRQGKHEELIPVGITKMSNTNTNQSTPWCSSDKKEITHRSEINIVECEHLTGSLHRMPDQTVTECPDDDDDPQYSNGVIPNKAVVKDKERKPRCSQDEQEFISQTEGVGLAGIVFSQILFGSPEMSPSCPIVDSDRQDSVRQSTGAIAENCEKLLQRGGSVSILDYSSNANQTVPSIDIVVREVIAEIIDNIVVGEGDDRLSSSSQQDMFENKTIPKDDYMNKAVENRGKETVIIVAQEAAELQDQAHGLQMLPGQLETSKAPFYANSPNGLSPLSENKTISECTKLEKYHTASEVERSVAHDTDQKLDLTPEQCVPSGKGDFLKKQSHSYIKSQQKLIAYRETIPSADVKQVVHVDVTSMESTSEKIVKSPSKRTSRSEELPLSVQSQRSEHISDQVSLNQKQSAQQSQPKDIELQETPYSNFPSKVQGILSDRFIKRNLIVPEKLCSPADQHTGDVCVVPDQSQTTTLVKIAEDGVAPAKRARSVNTTISIETSGGDQYRQEEIGGQACSSWREDQAVPDNTLRLRPAATAAVQARHLEDHEALSFYDEHNAEYPKDNASGHNHEKAPSRSAICTSVPSQSLQSAQLKEVIRPQGLVVNTTEHHVGSSFRWKYAPPFVCAETNATQGIDDDAPPPLFQPLPQQTHSRPRRVGLSRRHRGRSLHPNYQLPTNAFE